METFETALVAFALWLVYRKSRCPAPLGGDRERQIDWRRLLRKGFRCFSVPFAIMIYMRSDILILGKIAGVKTVGIYSVASPKITEAWHCFRWPLCQRFFRFWCDGADAASHFIGTIRKTFSRCHAGRPSCRTWPNECRAAARALALWPEYSSSAPIL